MNRARVLALGAMLVLAASTQGQQQSPNKVNASLPSVQEQLKILTGKLDLSTDQRAKVKSILQELHDVTIKLMEDKNLTDEQRLSKVQPERMKADGKIRLVLNEDQKKKLDAYEQGPHHEMHGDLEGKKE